MPRTTDIFTNCRSAGNFYLYTCSRELIFDQGAGLDELSEMNQLYGEPVNVRARDDGGPIRFVWRGRLYTVRAILEHWVINREWWRDPGTPGNPGEPELEFWRVE